MHSERVLSQPTQAPIRSDRPQRFVESYNRPGTPQAHMASGGGAQGLPIPKVRHKATQRRSLGVAELCRGFDIFPAVYPSRGLSAWLPWYGSPHILITFHMPFENETPMFRILRQGPGGKEPKQQPTASKNLQLPLGNSHAP